MPLAMYSMPRSSASPCCTSRSVGRGPNCQSGPDSSRSCSSQPQATSPAKFLSPGAVVMMSSRVSSAQTSQSKSTACTVPGFVAWTRKVRFRGMDSLVSVRRSISRTQTRSLRRFSGKFAAPQEAFQYTVSCSDSKRDMFMPFQSRGRMTASQAGTSTRVAYWHPPCGTTMPPFFRSLSRASGTKLIAPSPRSMVPKVSVTRMSAGLCCGIRSRSTLEESSATTVTLDPGKFFSLFAPMVASASVASAGFASMARTCFAPRFAAIIDRRPLPAPTSRTEQSGPHCGITRRRARR
mmetsp:Transcript_70106/g.205522  ORF Transcript_70106/g.205522 Transcript_70106/m.205522 type:complete len:294 (-) Transcript_70106:165-1046(-)